MSPSPPSVTMTDLKAAARAGDAQAIAKLMNTSFQPKGIRVKVARSGPVLKVLMEGASLPDRKLAGAVRKGLDGIKPAGVEKVLLKAQVHGTGQNWTEVWNLNTSPPTLSNVSPFAKQGISSASQQPTKGASETVFPAFQFLIICTLALAVGLNLFTWSDPDLGLGAHIIAVIFFAITLAFLIWTFFTEKGRNFSDEYNRRNADPSTTKVMAFLHWYISGFNSKADVPWYASPALLRVLMTVVVISFIVAPFQSLLEGEAPKTEVAISQEEAPKNNQPSCTQAAGSVYADVRLYRDAQCTQPFATVVGGGKLSNGQRGVLIKFDTGEMEWKTRDAVTTQAYIRSNDPAVDAGLWREINQ